MRIKRIASTALSVMSSVLVGGCTVPEGPPSVSSSIVSVSLVETPPPRVGKDIQVSVRLTDTEGASLELLHCTQSLDRFDGQRWESVEGRMCSLPAGEELAAYPVVDGVLTERFAAPSVPGRYRLVVGVRRAGRKELIPVNTQFELSAAQTTR
jgi:hypothetical protein